MGTSRVNGRAHHLLVVEDSAIIALDLEYSLQELGIARVTIAANLARAKATLAAGGVDAALVDVFLDREDGLTIARELKARDIPFALMTGLGETADLKAEFPGTPILSKPFSKDELEAVVTSLC